MVAYSTRGYFEWLVQRVTAVLVGVYLLFLIGFIYLHPNPNQADWHSLFSSHSMQIFTLIMLFGLLWHAWVGLWTVFTDYIKPVGLRLVLQVMLLLLLATYWLWCAYLFWR